MPLLTPKAKQAHPIASQIPNAAWQTIFYSTLDENDINIAGKSLDNLTRGDLPKNNRKALIILLLGYPNSSAADIINFAQNVLKASFADMFLCCSIMGALDSLKYLTPQAPQTIMRFITQKEFLQAFTWAADENHLNVLNWLKKQEPNQLDAMIRADDYAVFRRAASGGHLDTLQWLAEQVPGKLDSMIGAKEYGAFQKAAGKGRLATLQWLAEKVPGELDAMIRAKEYGAFQNAAGKGRLATLQWLAEKVPGELDAMIRADDYYAFRRAAAGGHLDILQWLAEQAPSELDSMIRAKGYDAFRMAAAYGHLDTLKWLAEKAPDELIAMADDYDAVKKAVAGGHLDTLQWLAEQAPGELDAMIQADDYLAFKKAAHHGHPHIIQWLLAQPSCFAYAEAHLAEYAPVVTPFMEQTLATLHQERDALIGQNPNAVFDLPEEQRAHLCFYVMRHLIRRNDRALDDELRFLLDIPAVKALVHRELSPGNSNELFRLALSLGNTEAAILLLNIEAVRALAEENDYYRAEAHGGVDLGQLAQDRESSMTALTQGEAQRLKAATDRYQPMIETVGVPVLMEELKTTLTQRYEQHPAQIQVAGENLILPIDFAAFNALNLTDEDYQNALKAYYLHPDHTTLRYLSKPNAWMHLEASYVYVSEDRTQSWSSFEEYQPLIALFYLAAIDAEVSPSEGYTLETRLDHFIQELALIGRAHNWDKTRMHNGIREEYDDLEGDRPSCFSGVKRRLFQSVVGHSLFEVVTEEKIDAELTQWAFTHFLSVLPKVNLNSLHEVLDEFYYGALSEEEIQQIANIEALAPFNLPPHEIKAFIDALSAKYGPQFNAFRLYVAQQLTLNSDKVGTSYHLLKLDNLIKFYVYLMDKYPPAQASKEQQYSASVGFTLFSQPIDTVSLTTPNQDLDESSNIPTKGVNGPSG